MTNPFAKFLPPGQDNPFAKFMDQPDFESSRGRLQADYESRAKLVEALKKALEKPGISVERKAMLERVIKENEPESTFGTANSIGESVKRFVGGAVGSIPSTAMAATDLLLAGADLVDPTGLAKRGREKMAEGQAALQEVTGAEGAEGILGGLAGGIGVASLPAGAAGAAFKTLTAGQKVAAIAKAPLELFARPAQAILKGGSKIIPAVAKGVTGNVIQRVAGQAIADIPVNAAQAASIPNATKEEKLKAFAIQSAMSAAGGVIPARKGKAEPETKIETIEAPGKPIEELSDIVARTQAKQIEVELKKKAKLEAIEAWKNANPDKDWNTDLSKNDKKRFIDERLEALRGSPSETPALPAEPVPVVAKVEDVVVAEPGIKGEVGTLGNADELKVADLEARSKQLQEAYTVAYEKAKIRNDFTESDAIMRENHKVISQIREAKLRSDTVKYGVDTKAIDRLSEADTHAKIVEYNTRKQSPLDFANGIPRLSPKEETELKLLAEHQSKLLKAKEHPKLDEFEQLQDQVMFGNGKTLSNLEDIRGTPEYVERFEVATKMNAVSNALRSGQVVDPSMIERAIQLMRSTMDKYDTAKRLPAEDRVKAREARIGEPKIVTEERAPGVGPEEPGTVAIFKRIKQLKLGQAVKTAVKANDFGVGQLPHVEAELAARGVLATYDEAIARGMSQEQATIETHAVVAKAYKEKLAFESPDTVVAKSELETIEWGKALSKSSQGDIDILKGKVLDKLDVLPVDSPEYQAALRDIAALAKVTARPGAEPVPATKALIPPKKAVVLSDIEIVTRKASAPTEPEPIDPNAFRALWRTPPDKIIPEQLTVFRDALLHKLMGLDTETGKPYSEKLAQIQKLLTDKLDVIDEVKANRENPPRTDGEPIQLNTTAQAVGAAVGAALGYNSGDTPEERLRNAAIFGLAGWAGGSLINRALKNKPEIPEKLVPGEEEYVDKIIETHGKDKKNPISFYQRLYNIYRNVVRPEIGPETAEYTLSKGEKVPAHLSFAKSQSHFGFYVGQSDQFFVGDPYIILQDGTRQPVNVPNAMEILHASGGSIARLGRVSAALGDIERFNNGKPVPGVSINRALQFIQNAPPELIRGAQQLRQWHAALLDQIRIAGVIDDASYSKMLSEEYYSPIKYIFGGETGEKPPTIGSKVSKIIGSPNPVKARTGGLPNQRQNPFELALEVAPRMLRAAELNMSKQKLLAWGASVSPEERNQFIRPAPRNKSVDDPTIAVKAKQIQEALGLSPEQSISMAAAFSEKIDALSPSMTVYRNGTLQTWRLNSSIAESFMNLAPYEQSWIVDLLSPTTNLARKGIVYNPLFVAYQAFRDNWQMTMNSEYGFAFGKDQLRGYMALMRGTELAKEYQRMGGGDIRYLAHDILSLKEALKTVQTHGETPWATAKKQIIGLHPVDAYKSMIQPIYEAARMGEYMRARGAGADALEAIYAAKRVGGNYQRIGTQMKAMSRVALFLKPAIRAMDEAFYSSGVHPFRPPPESRGFKFGSLQTSGKGIEALAGLTKPLIEEVNTGVNKIFGTHLPESVNQSAIEGRTAAGLNYAIKGFVGISSVSYLLHAANGDDEQINEYRKSPGGSRFWWMRVPVLGIIKVPKPIFEGQLFGTTIEAALDSFKDKDPEAWRRWADAVMQDASMNLLPLAAAVPASVWANKDYNFGTPIIPQGMEQMDPEFQVKPETTMPARFVGKMLGPISNNLESDAARRALSPIGIDYITRQFGGAVLQESMVGLTQAIEYLQKGYLHPAYELPFLRRQLVEYPKNAMASIEEFYRHAERVGRVANTLNSLTSNPQEFQGYYQRNKELINQIDLFDKARTEFADYWHSMNEIKKSSEFSPDQKRAVTDEMMRKMIETTRMINVMARSIK